VKYNSSKQRRLDAEWREAGHEAAGYMCELKCGRASAEAHHMIGRGDAHFRNDPRNCLSVCCECHDLSKKELTERLRVVNPARYEDYQELLRLRIHYGRNGIKSRDLEE